MNKVAAMLALGLGASDALSQPRPRRGAGAGPSPNISTEANLAIVGARSAAMAKAVRKRLPGAEKAQADKVEAAVAKRERKAAVRAARGHL